MHDFFALYSYFLALKSLKCTYIYYLISQVTEDFSADPAVIRSLKTSDNNVVDIDGDITINANKTIQTVSGCRYE
jgi:hypothetical protein